SDDGAPGSIGCPIVDGNAGGTACNAVAVAAQGEAPDAKDPAPPLSPVRSAVSSDRQSRLGLAPPNPGSTNVAPVQRANPRPGSFSPPTAGFTGDLVPSPTATLDLPTATAVPAALTPEAPVPTATLDLPTATVVRAAVTPEPPVPTAT